MQIIKREELPEQRQVRLTIAVDKDTWQASLAKCYQGVKSVCPVAGEPTRENLEQAYGPEFLYQEAGPPPCRWRPSAPTATPSQPLSICTRRWSWASTRACPPSIPRWS